MPQHDPVQVSFSGGEISPRLLGRVDSELYRKSLKYCSDWEPFPHGGTKTRRGTQYRAMPTDLTKDCRLIEFPIAAGKSKMVVLGGEALRVYDDQGLVGVGTTNLLQNPTFWYGLDYWTPEHAFMEAGRCYLKQEFIENGFQYGTITQPFTAQALTYSLVIRAELAPLQEIRISVGSTEGGEQVLGETITTAQAKYVQRNVTFAAPGTFYLRIRTLNTEGLQTPGGNYYGASIFQASLVNPKSSDVEFTGVSYPYLDTQLAGIQFVADASNNRMILVHPQVAPWELQFDAATASWTFEAITFTSAPTEWGAGKYPGAVEIYQGRLWLGGVEGHSNTFWASKSGSLYDFTLGTNADDALALDISTKGAIQWFQGHRQLLVGTDRGEYTITAQGGVVTPTDFNVRPESAFGSGPVQGINIGEVALYVTRDRRKIRALSYNLQENGYQSRDVTFVAEHLTADLVREIHWAPDPNDTLVVLLQSGLMVFCVFNRAEQVAAWWRVNVGTVYSAAVVNGTEGSEVWMLVQRAGGVCLEVLPLRDDPDAVYLDSHVAGARAASFTGLDHLEGETVGVVLDGNFSATDRVVSSGAVAISETATTAAAGLRYRPKMVKLPLEGGNPRGSSIGAKRRYTRLGLRLNDSALPLVNGSRPFPDRSPSTPMDTVEGRHTGDVKTNLLGWEDQGAITIEQDLPLRTEILAIFGTVAVNEV